MKPVLEHLPRDAEESFVVRAFNYQYYPTPWHFHPEYELVLVTESIGKRFIGDNISHFSEGNMAFLGPNLPHLYRNEPEYYGEKSTLHARSIVIHFLESSFGNDFSSLPETKKINRLFLKSVRGLNITGKTNKIIANKMQELTNLKGFERLLALLEILHIMSESKDIRYISSGTILGINEKESDRMDKVLNFVLKNFHNDINLRDVAKIANMADNSFSRYFSQRTHKTFTSYVNEIRLSHACKLLRENNKSVADVCYECGFNNLSNFNRQFNMVYHTRPLYYRKQYLGKLE